MLHVTAAAAVLFISNGASAVRRGPSVRPSDGRVRGKDPALPCPCNRRRRARRRTRAPPEQEKKETILSKAILSGADALAPSRAIHRTDERTSGRADGRSDMGGAAS